MKVSKMSPALRIIKELNRPSALRLMCGELSVGEVRLLTSVLNALALRIKDAEADDDRRNAVLDEAIAAVDKELEDGSPQYTWSDMDHAVNDARVRALEAIIALKGESPSGGGGEK